MKKLLTFLAVMLFASCGKKIDTNDVLESLSLSTTTVNADGSSTVEITAVLNSAASADKRNVVITATGGDLVGGTSGKLIVPATFVNGQLVGKSNWKAPMSKGEITITAKAEAQSPNGDYQLMEKITALHVDPASISLETSSFGIGANFTTTDTLIGILSAYNKKVSTGARVSFEDFLMTVPVTSANGRFRFEQLSSDANSQVKGLYSADNHPIGTHIYIECAVLNPDGTKTTKRDTVIITVNQ